MRQIKFVLMLLLLTCGITYAQDEGTSHPPADGTAPFTVEGVFSNNIQFTPATVETSISKSTIVSGPYDIRYSEKNGGDSITDVTYVTGPTCSKDWDECLEKRRITLPTHRPKPSIVKYVNTKSNLDLVVDCPVGWQVDTFAIDVNTPQTRRAWLRAISKFICRRETGDEMEARFEHRNTTNEEWFNGHQLSLRLFWVKLPSCPATSSNSYPYILFPCKDRKKK